jgi:hypothetical protein
MALTPFEWAYLIITIVSTGYSIAQSKKMKSDAKKAADARRGFEIPIEGEGMFAPVVYGRAKIGGSRVFHQTKSDFLFVEPNSDNEFHAGNTMDMIRPIIFKMPVLPGDPGYNNPNYAIADSDDYPIPTTDENGDPLPPPTEPGTSRWADVSMTLY